MIHISQRSTCLDLDPPASMVNSIKSLNVYYGQREEILSEELKQKTVLERKQYNSKMAIGAEIAL